MVISVVFFVSGDRPIHVSYDIDSLDPKETPSTGTPGERFVSSSTFSY